MRWIWSKFRVGILALIPVLLIVLVINWLVGAIVTASFPIVENKVLNFFINTAIWFSVICLLGWLVSMRWCRSLVLKLCARIPILSSISSTLLSHDYIEQIKSGELTTMREVIFKMGEDWAFGIVMNRLMLPENPKEKGSPLVWWCVVIGPLTPPLSFTSQMRVLKESDVTYTGRNGKECTLTVATFGLNLKLNPSQFINKKPQ